MLKTIAHVSTVITDLQKFKSYFLK